MNDKDVTTVNAPLKRMFPRIQFILQVPPERMYDPIKTLIRPVH